MVAESQALLSSQGNQHAYTLMSDTDIDEPEAQISQPENHHHRIDDDILPETATYGRNLGWSSAYILVISRVVGSGIFATPGSIFKSAGSIGLTVLLWVVGTIVGGVSLAVSMELGCAMPRSGGDKVYLEYTYRHPRFLASTLIAVQAVLLGFSASNCIIFSKYTLFAFNVQASELQSKLLAATLLTVVTLIHGRFRKVGVSVQDVLGWVKIFLVLAMCFTGIWVIAFGHNGSVDQGNSRDGTAYESTGGLSLSWDEIWRDSNWSWGLLSTSLFKVFYSYAGLSNVNNVLNEVRNPVRTLKTVCPAALLTACALYLLANISYFLVIPMDEIKSSGELVGALFFERVFGLHVGRILFPLAIAISAAGNVMVVTFALVSDFSSLLINSIKVVIIHGSLTYGNANKSKARVNQEIARQGFLPFSRLLSSSRPFNSPLGGLFVHYVPSVLVIMLPPQGDVYNFILDVEGYPAQIFGLAVSAGLLVLRYREPDLPRPFKAWLPAVWLRILVSLALLAAPFFPPPEGKGDVGFFYATYAIVGVGM